MNTVGLAFMNNMQIRSIDISVVNLNLNDAAKAVNQLIKSKMNAYICFLEANLLALAVSDKKLQDVLKKADIVFPDGVVLSILNRINGKGKIQRISGPSFMLKMCEYGQTLGVKHFFYGGAEGVPEKLAKNLKEKYSDLLIAGTYSPPFRTLTDEEELNVKQMIENSGADLLWVGLGGPKQEYWMAKHVNKINVSVMLGVGAAFDYHSGNRLWAPKIIRNLGLEWMFRMFFGGRRIFFRNLRCVFILSFLFLLEIIERKLIVKILFLTSHLNCLIRKRK